MPKYKWMVVALLLVVLTIIVFFLNTIYGVILALSELIAFGLLYKIDYSGKTIDNIIQQLEAIKKEVEKD